MYFGSTLKCWELYGFFFIVCIGSLLHFAFDWSGRWWPLALFAAVNESTWEHLKLTFWPGCCWMLLERQFLPVLPAHFWASKGIALTVPPLAIIVIVELYTSITSRNILAIDVSTFVIAVALGQYVSIRCLQNPLPIFFSRSGNLLLLIQLIAYSLFTYFPPPQQIFVDPRYGLRGIEARAIHANSDEIYQSTKKH